MNKLSKKILIASFTSFFLLPANQLVYSQWDIAGQVSGLTGVPRICVVDSNIVWVAGGTGTSPKVFRTINGGLNWTEISTNGLPYFLLSLAAKDSVNAFVADGGSFNHSGGNAKFFKTTNAGLNWILIDSTGGTLGYFNGIHFSKTHPNFGIAHSDPPGAAGDPYHLNITRDGGVTWTRHHPPGVPDHWGLQYTVFVIDSLFYGSGIASPVTLTMDSYITSNGGSSWYRGFEALPLPFGDVVFSDNKLSGLLMTPNFFPNVKITTNGGLNWTNVNINSSISGPGTAAWVSGTNTVFICAASNGNGNTIIRSDNRGLNWTEQNTSNVINIREIDYKRYGNVIVAYAISANSIILKSRQTVTPVSVNQIGTEIPVSLSLSQNYPNPFNPATTIKFDSPKNNNIMIKIYDLTGKEIETLVNEYKSAGSYEVEFNGFDYSSGVYFYSLFADGNLIDTKRMILLK